MEIEKEQIQEEKTEQKEIKIQVVKEGRIKRTINYIISALLLILVIFVAITIKNALDDTVSIETKLANQLCDYDACIVFQGIYEKGFVDWNVRDYWPFFMISIGSSSFKEEQEVNIICSVDLKTDTFQHIFTKIYFLYSKDNIKSCTLSSV